MENYKNLDIDKLMERYKDAPPPITPTHENDGIIRCEYTYIDGIGPCAIIMFENEPDGYPHIHLISFEDTLVNGEMRRFDGAIRLDMAAFYPHGVSTDTFGMLGEDESE